MTKRATMMEMSLLNMMIAKIRMIEKTLKMTMGMRKARRSLEKKVRRRYERRRNNARNLIKIKSVKPRKLNIKKEIVPLRYPLRAPTMMIRDCSK